jgi:hypothetical protein
MPFHSLRIEYQYRGRPHCVESMEVSRVFFDVCFKRYEVLADE